MNWFELIAAVAWMAITVLIIIGCEDMDGDESEG